MSLVQVQVNADAVARMEKILAGFPGGAEKAFRGAIKRAADSLESSTSKRIRERYAISHENIRTNKSVRIRYSYAPGQGAKAEIVFSGHRIPLYRFDGSGPGSPSVDRSRYVPVLLNGWKMVHPSENAYGHQLKSTGSTQFDHAFVTRFKSGHVGIFQRTGGKTENNRDQIRELFGSSVPQMLGSPEVAEKLAGDAARKFDERLDSEITRILNGF